MKIREANLTDANSLVPLMEQLGYEVSTPLMQEKLAEFSESENDIVYVAEHDKEVLGVITCHITRLFHQSGNAGRITSLAIDEASRGLGVGKNLVREAEQFFLSLGCVKAEVTSGDQRPKAHQFYENLGYKRNERRFLKQFQQTK
ncbi:MAG: GNAT family N-acetyltransferase [Cyanobacteria bacterium P01_H01_bin.15]